MSSTAIDRRQDNFPFTIARDLRRVAFHKFSDALKRQRLSCKFQCNDLTVNIGAVDAQNPNDCIFRFESIDNLKRFLNSPRLLRFGKLFIDGHVNIVGDLERGVDIVCEMQDCPETLVERLILQIPFLRPGSNIVEHYNDCPRVYELFLDKNMQYTCGLFNADSDDLELAQINKLELAAERLRLKKGSKLLDIGCGWGGAIEYWSLHYGVEAVGLTNSLSQAEYAMERLRRHSVEAEIFCGDFTRFRRPEYFDAITVIGMLEHVRSKDRHKLFDFIYQHLKPGGRAYIQCITKSKKWIGGDGTRFLKRYVFPGFEISRFDEICDQIENAGLKVCNDTAFEHGSHYAQTASFWINNLKASKSIITRESLFNERQYRILFGYLAIGSKIFRDGRGSLHRFIVTK